MHALKAYMCTHISTSSQVRAPAEAQAGEGELPEYVGLGDSHRKNVGP